MADLIHVSDDHGEAEVLLPWYATGQLDGEEQAFVENHLLGCAHCRRQLAGERRMIEEFAAMAPDVDVGWERLRGRVQPSAAHRPGPSERMIQHGLAAWHALRRPAVAAVALAQVAFVLVAGSLLFSLSRPSYRALGSAPPPQSANVIVMFRGDTTDSRIHDLLRSSAASVVGGPTSTDAYLLRVPGQSRAAAIARLRSDRHVLMAEPIDGKSS